MSHPLLGVVEKLSRCNAHIAELYAKGDRYVQSAPYEMVAKRDTGHGHPGLIFRVTREPEPQLAVIIGDALHNLRSALNYIVIELVKANRQQPGFDTQFPICKTETDFINEAFHRGRILGVSSKGYAIVNGFQPHQIRHRFDQHPLWRLHKLSNLDKHNELVVSTLGTTAHWECAARDGQVLRRDSLEAVMYDGAIVASMPAHFLDEDVQLNGRINTHLAFRNEPVAGMEPVTVLHDICEFIGSFVLAAAESQFDPLPNSLRLPYFGLSPELINVTRLTRPAPKPRIE